MIFKTIHDIKVSSIVLGTDTFGTDTSESESFALLDSFLELGGTTVDTARVYGCHYGGGERHQRAYGRQVARLAQVPRQGCHLDQMARTPPLDSMTTGAALPRRIESDIDAEPARSSGVDCIEL